MNDHIEICVDMDMATFDPNNLIAGASRRLANSICPGLFGVGEDWQLKGLLAEGWSVDGRHVEVQLRADVELHNGASLDATLVRRNFERILSPAAECYQRRDLEVLERIEVLGDHRILFVLKEPCASFPSLLANHIGMTDVDALRSGALPIGAGPYRCAEWVPGQHMNLELVGPASQAPKTITWKIDPSPSNRAEGLLDGIHHAVWMPATQYVDELRTRGFETFSKRSEAPTHLTFNFTKSPWNVREVRQAVASAIDRQALVDAVLGDHAVESWTAYPSHSRWNAPIPAPESDPEHARWLLRKAGHTQIVDTLPVDSDFGVRMGNVVAEQLRAVGIDVKVERHESPSWWPGHYLSGNWGIILQTWTPMPDPDQLIARRYHSNGVLNSGKFRSERVDEALENGRRELDPLKRKEHYDLAQRILFDEVASVYLFHADMVSASRIDWVGFEPTVLSELDLTAIRPREALA